MGGVSQELGAHFTQDRRRSELEPPSIVGVRDTSLGAYIEFWHFQIKES